jgi:hypothetical protein
MNNDNTQDDAEPSLASAGSQPVGWGAVASDGSVVCMMRRRADVASYVVDGTPIVPLYRQPTLTDEEREAIRRAIFRCTVSARARRLSGMDDLADEDRKDAETFSGLLKRIG